MCVNCQESSYITTDGRCAPCNLRCDGCNGDADLCSKCHNGDILNAEGFCIAKDQGCASYNEQY